GRGERRGQGPSRSSGTGWAQVGTRWPRRGGVKGKRGARGWAGRAPKAPAMSFHDRGADGQAHADPTWFGRKKRLENSLGIRRVNARATILHRHQRTAIL